MQDETLWLVVAIALVVVALSIAAVAWALVRLARAAEQAATEAGRLIEELQEELPATLAALQRTSDSLDQLAGESGARLVTMDRLAEEATQTMGAVRDLSGAVHDIVRGPADTVTGVKRSARMVGEGIASGADRLRRVITGDPDGSGGDGT
ncbi:MAG: hypothetical protein KF809_18190 [Chloroflexi bacterium]|nr:hypothetical protein [Chloroflexota bacterium]